MSLPGLFKVSSAYKPTAEIETFLGEPGELFYSSTQRVVVISDGVTPGGNLLNSLRVVDYTEGEFTNVRYTGTLAFDTSNFALEAQPNGTIKISVIGIDDDGIGGGSNINVLGSFTDISQLPEIATVGDSYLINTELYVWQGEEWENVGPVRGPQGYTGSRGEVGYTGSAGYTGSGGYTGSQGDIGYTGSQGDIGYTGSKGYTGSQGDIGYTGSQGDIGYTGSQGDIGYVGSEGYTGSQGDQGYTGSQGDVGYVGSQGDVGYTGSQGDPGTSVTIQGSVPTAEDLPNPFGGNIGDGYITQDDGALHVWDGEQWNNVGEVKGPKGDTGFTGSIGYTGSEGPVGFTGSMGYTGSQGAGIIDVEIIGDDLVITYEDSSKKNIGRVVGYDGSGSGGGSIDGFTSNSIDTITLNTGYSIIPETDDEQDLGSLTNRFRDVYVGPGSLHLGNTVISSDEEDDLQVKDSAGAYRNVRLNNLVLGPTTTLPTNPTTGIVFANGTVQTTSAPRFYSDGYLYFDDLGNNRITAGDYLYDYVNGTLFVTSFIPFNGWVTNRGVGYQPTEEFAILDDVPLIGGSGSGAEASVIVYFGEIFEISLTEQGTGYALGDSLGIELNDGGSGFEVIVNSVDVNTGAINNGYLQLFDITVY
jgi:hypothetical protein